MKKSFIQRLQENMRRFRTKNLNEIDDKDQSDNFGTGEDRFSGFGPGSLQRPGMSSSPEWFEYYKKWKPDNKDMIRNVSGWLVETQALIGDRLNYMQAHIEQIDSFLPEIAEMIDATQTILDTIKNKFPIYYEELNRWEYNVVGAHKSSKAQLEAVLSDPNSSKTEDNLRDAAGLYAIYSEEALEARNSDKVTHEIERFLGVVN